jgi:hypothetical protein
MTEPSRRAEAHKDWIQKAVRKPGALRRQLKVPEGKKIPLALLRAAAKADGKLGQRARLALALRKMG